MIYSPRALLRQTGNFCVIFSILNALRTPERRHVFLQTTPEEDEFAVDLKNIKAFFIDNFPYYSDGKFEHGIVPADIWNYLTHLQSLGVIVHWKWRRCTNNLWRFSKPQAASVGAVFIVSGWGGPSEYRKKVIKNFHSNEDSGEDKVHAMNLFIMKMKNNGLMPKMDDGSVITPKAATAGGSLHVSTAKFTKSLLSPHAVCVSIEEIVNAEGAHEPVAVLSDPGRNTVRLLDNHSLDNFGEEFCNSLLHIFHVHCFEFVLA